MTAKRRPTIGVLVGFAMYDNSYPYAFVANVVHGIQSAARDQGINLLVGCGINRGIGTEPREYPAGPVEFSTSDFIPVGHWNTDGLVVLSPLFLQEEIQYIREIQGKGYPVVFISSGFGTPMIKVDSEGGMHQAVEHLAEHGHRDIAFIAGVEGDGDSESRLKAYREVVQELGLTNDPRLLEFGRHLTANGYDATKRILQSGVKFTAVACSNDDSAVGAIRAIREAGLRIPWDVAVMGFDDQVTALTQVPPLATVRYPLFETGYRALLLMRKRLEYGPGSIPEVTRVSTRLVPRQSCGCIPEMVKSSIIHPGATFDSDRLDSQGFKEGLSQAMMESLRAEATTSDIADSRPLCDRLVDTFLLSLEDGDLSHFQIGLIDVIQQIETMGEASYPWQSAISILNEGAHALLAEETDPGRKERVENLVNQARIIINESTERRYVRDQFRQDQI